jgi:energy-coupling factor transport system permease protein
MSETWDYLSKVTIGQYSPINSAFHRLDVRVRMLTIFFLLVGLLAAHFPLGLLFPLLLTLLLIFSSRMPFKYALRGLLPPLPFILILAALQILFNSYADSGTVLYHTTWFTLSLTDIWAGLALVIRFCALVLLIGLASFCLSTTDLIKGLGALLHPLEWLRMPVRDFILIIQVTLRFIPLLALTAERIAKAQASRGANWGGKKGGLIAKARRVVPILIPLFVQALHKAEVMALAMDSRGYRTTAKIPRLPYKKIQPGEILALGVSLGGLVIGILY